VPNRAIELILARNLLAAVELAGFIVDPDGVVVYFNEPAGELVGQRFEEVGPLRREEWSSRFGPFDELGQLMPTDGLPLTVALRDGLPANGCFRVRVGSGELLDIAVSALPLVTVDGFAGAIVAFWPADTTWGT
jgi:PAS domain-containing protein